MIHKARQKEIHKAVTETLRKVDFFNDSSMDITAISGKLDVCLVPIEHDIMTAIKRNGKPAPGYFEVLLINGEERNVIYYDVALSEQQKNFVLVHELGHFVLKHTQQCPMGEDEANFFAENILMKMGIASVVQSNMEQTEYKAIVGLGVMLLASFILWAVKHGNKISIEYKGGDAMQTEEKSSR